jgi:hypothetical protein
MDGQGSAHWSDYASAYRDLADLCLQGGLNTVNISTSDFAEQRSGGPAKVQSGTYAIIYRLRNPNPRAMALGPLLARAETAPDLDFNLDVRPTLEQSISSYRNFRAYVIRVLFRYSKGFAEYTEGSAFQFISRRPMPEDYITNQFPVRLSTIEEHSIPGNLSVHENVFVTQLKLTYAELSKKSDFVHQRSSYAGIEPRLQSCSCVRYKSVSPCPSVPTWYRSFPPLPQLDLGSSPFPQWPREYRR